MKRICVLLAAVMLAACQDHSPTGIASRTVPAGGASRATLSVDHAIARLAIDDVVDRIMPTLRDAERAREVGAALKELSQALLAGDTDNVLALALVAQDAVQHYASVSPGDAVDVDAIRQALAVVTIKEP